MVSVNVPKLTLTYFKFANRAEPIRLAAVIGKIPFTNRVVEFPDWPTLKHKTPLGQIPVLHIESDGRSMDVCQSVAILRYIGKLGGLYPEDPMKALMVDSIMDTIKDMLQSLVLSIQGPKANMLGEEPSWSKEEVLAIRKRICENKEKGWPFYLQFFEGILKLNKDSASWLVGDSITIADLEFHRIVPWIVNVKLDGIPPEILNDYPLIRAHADRIESLPQVMAFRAAHAMPYTNFEFQP